MAMELIQLTNSRKHSKEITLLSFIMEIADSIACLPSIILNSGSKRTRPLPWQLLIFNSIFLDALAPPQLKQERQDVDKFIERNSRSVSLLNRAFYKNQFSALTTAKEMVSIINTANAKKGDAKFHSMKIMLEIPDKGPQSVELRFLEIAEEIYWIPIGW